MLSRRQFVKTTLIASASAAVTPVAEALAKSIDICAAQIEEALKRDAAKDVHVQFHLIDNNLLNLHFYFLNTKKERRGLCPNNPDSPSFMIIRLPQQHVSEAGFWDQDWKDPLKAKPEAMLSGFSYLAFRIWPPTEDNCKRRQYLELNVENLLDWNKDSTFQLITLIDWLELKQAGNQFQFQHLADSTSAKQDERDKENATRCTEFKEKKRWTTKDLPPRQRDTTESQSEIFRRYKSIVEKLFNGNASAKNCSFIPVTFFEVPHEVCLVPLIRKQPKDPKKLTHKPRFWKNLLSPKPSKKNGARKYEVWNNTLLYERIQSAEQPTAQQFVFETPSFRIAGLITDVDRNPSCPPGSIKCESEPGKTDKKQDILPTLLDKMELAYLTQFAKDDGNPATGDRTDPEFDIKEVNGFFFTGLGAITHLKYATQKNLPTGIDLIEYEHRITEGRDVFIKVARLGYNSKTGQKYKHVIEGTRKITTEPKSPDRPPLASFIELKQYCECIEPEIDYTKYAEDNKEGKKWDNQQYFPYTNRPTIPIPETNPIFPIFRNDCHYRRNPFRSLKNTDTKRVPISCLTHKIEPPGACKLEEHKWFWVIKERPDKNSSGLPVQDSEILIEDYVPCHFEATDWEGATHTASTPFMFIRQSYIEAVPNDNPAYANYLSGTYDKTGLRDPLVERRLTHLNGKAIAFTPTPKPQTGNNNSNDPTYNSKTNILETEYLESYFMIKNIKKTDDPDSDKKSTAEKQYVVFPQVLRARVYLDHIRDMAQKKIPSIVEFHPQYVQLGLKTDGANYGKLILRHTDVYKNGTEELQNNTYSTIKTALQQAKNQLGNLAVPDIVPDAISLDQSGITLPDNLEENIGKGLATIDEGTKKLKAISPRAILRGQLSEILGGIDLTAILDELLPQENSPQFELTKLANELEKVEQSVLGSPVYKKILQELKDSKKKIEDAIAEVNGLLVKVKEARSAVNNALQKISREVPNVDELDLMIKNLFERYRTQAFEVLLDNIEFEKVEGLIQKAGKQVGEFLAQELYVSKLEYEHRHKEVLRFFSGIETDLKNLPGELQKIGPEGLSPSDYFESKIGELYRLVIEGAKDSTTGTIKPFNNYEQKVSDIFRTIADDVQIKVDRMENGKRVEYAVFYKVRQRQNESEVEWELTDKRLGAKPLNDLDLTKGLGGYVQVKKKVDDFRALVTGNLRSTSQFHRDAVAELLRRISAHENTLAGLQQKVESFQKTNLEPVSKSIRDWNDVAEKYRQGPYPAATKESIRRVQELMLKGNAYVDFLRKADPYFYYVEQQRLKKDIRDIERRLFPAFATLCGQLEESRLCTGVKGQCSPLPKFKDLAGHVWHCICNYKYLRSRLIPDPKDPKWEPIALNDYVDQLNTCVKNPLGEIVHQAIEYLKTNSNDEHLQEIYKKVQDAKKHLEDIQERYDKSYKKYLSLIGDQAQKELSDIVQTYIKDKEKRLREEIDSAAIQDLQATIAEARNVYRLLTSIKQQDLTYKWSTTQFRDANLGILTFKKGSAPDTKLDVDVRVTTHFSPGKFPPAIVKVETQASNRLTNFGIGFFNVLTVSFSEVSFQAQSGQSPHCDVKIKDVKFDGAFAFVQEFEKWMAGKGLFLNVAPDHLQLGYSLPIPAIQTPAFSFFNLTLNFDIRLHFDNRPMRFGFSFARPDLKFGIAAGIYAGFGFFGLVGDPKRGIVEMDAALEAGAWKGISIGPISGEVKLAFGFRYTRTEASVRLEGYIVAEGRLSVWIIEVSARIYLGVVSENSYVEGQCTVTYSAKLGFISKSFSGTFHQRIAGAKSKNNNEQVNNLVKTHHLLSSRLLLAPPFKALSEMTEDERKEYEDYEETLRTEYSKKLRDYENQEVKPETAAVSRHSWKRFARIM